MFDPVIKWSGSKRSQTKYLVELFPTDYKHYFEPFVGGGSVMYAMHPKEGVCGDICLPLIDLWQTIQHNPKELAVSYREHWVNFQKEPEAYFHKVRAEFNDTKKPEDFLFITRTCMNGLIRFNSKGEFNTTVHHNRSGIHPDKLEKIILDWSERIQGITFLNGDYRATTIFADTGDFVYLDPPYFNTKQMYYGRMEFDPFLEYLDELNRKDIRFALSFDGIRGDNDLTADIPKDLYKRHLLIESGVSSFSRIVKKEREEIKESLYLSF